MLLALRDQCTVPKITRLTPRGVGFGKRWGVKDGFPLASTKRREVFSSSDFGFRASDFGSLRVTNLNQDLTRLVVKLQDKGRLVFEEFAGNLPLVPNVSSDALIRGRTD